ncbi:MAG: heme-binding protein [Acidobacteriota bacterium]
MRSSVIGALVIALALTPACHAAAGRQRSVRAGDGKPALISPVANAELPGCVLRFAAQQTCTDGSIGDGPPDPFGSLSPAEVQTIAEAALAAVSSPTPISVGIVDRTGRPLAVYQQAGATIADADEALGVARTAAFFSNSQAPLSSRTIRFISQVHFPPGLTNTSVGALYGIEQSNRGCDLNADWKGLPAAANQCVVRARTIAAFIANRDGVAEPLCDSTHSAGCGKGLVTGKLLPDDPPYPQTVSDRPVNAGGIPLFRLVGNGLARISEGIVSNGKLLGAIGVVGIPGNPDLAEFAAVTGAFAAAAIIPLPAYPLPDPQNVFIEGIRLPFLGANQKLRFNSNGLPIGLVQPAGSTPGVNNGTFLYGPYAGGCAPNGYLVGPKAGGSLSSAEVNDIVLRSVAVSKRTRAQVRLPLNSYARMVITVVDVDGSILAHYRMEDALFDAVDVVPAKARNVVYFNGADPSARTDLPQVPAGTWVTTRTVGFGAQPFYPPGIDSNVFNPRPGPWYSTLFLGNVTKQCSQGTQPFFANQNGVTFFAGATPLVRNGALVGGLGVSGDGIEQDDYVTVLGAGDFLPPRDRWADQLILDGARLPMFKYPRQPEGVTECGGGPCS